MKKVLFLLLLLVGLISCSKSEDYDIEVITYTESPLLGYQGNTQVVIDTIYSTTITTTKYRKK